MGNSVHSIKVSNERREPLTVWLEPWGEDYTLLPDETFDVVAEGASPDFYFDMACNEKDVLVYAEGDCTCVFVLRDGDALECGHNRERSISPSWDAL